jgi:hypothetical protein
VPGGTPLFHEKDDKMIVSDWNPDQQMQYVCKRTSQKPAMDGRLTSPVWQRAVRSPRFVDMISGGRPV